jgi:hypothetical protein
LKPSIKLGESVKQCNILISYSYENVNRFVIFELRHVELSLRQNTSSHTSRLIPSLLSLYIHNIKQEMLLSKHNLRFSFSCFRTPLISSLLSLYIHNTKQEMLLSKNNLSFPFLCDVSYRIEMYHVYWHASSSLTKIVLNLNLFFITLTQQKIDCYTSIYGSSHKLWIF